MSDISGLTLRAVQVSQSRSYGKCLKLPQQQLSLAEQRSSSWMKWMPSALGEIHSTSMKLASLHSCSPSWTEQQRRKVHFSVFACQNAICLRRES